MFAGPVRFGGVDVPFTSPVLLGVLACHVLAGLCGVVTGAAAALRPKRPGPHPWWGSAYYRSLVVAVVTATVLAAFRWSQDYYLFVLGAASLGAATLGRRARRYAWRRWVPMHIVGMSGSYVLLLTAFYLDNAHSLPLWRSLPRVTFWFLPAALAAPLVARALVRYREWDRPGAR